jgi:transposase
MSIPLPTTTRPHYELYVGVDISALTFDASLYIPRVSRNDKPEKACHYLHNEENYRRFTQQLAKRVAAPEATLVVMEATSTYWINLAIFLQQAGFAVSVVNPASARHYALSELKTTKTDAIDAQNLADMAAARPHKLSLWSPPAAIYHELEQRLSYRATLLEMRKTLKNQLHALKASSFGVAAVETLYQTQIDDFTTKLNELDKEIEKVLKTEPAWAKSVALLKTIPGVGPITAYYLVVVTLNFSTCLKAASLAKYVGLAPSVKTSGTSVKGTGSLGPSSHRPLRSALYMAANSAARFNPALKSFFEKLRTAGKVRKVAICAVARKLIDLAFALIRTKQPFENGHIHKQVVQTEIGA